MKRTAAPALIGAALMLLTACGVDGGGAAPPLDRGGDASAFEKLLARIPDTPTTRESLLIADVAAVRNLAGIEPPGPDVGGEAIADYLRLLSQTGTNGPATIFPRQEAWLAGLHEYALERPTWKGLGIDARNVDQVAVFQESAGPPTSVEVVAGRYDLESSSKALQECIECPPPAVVEHNGVTFWSWGEDMKQSLHDRLKPPAFDFLGRGGRIWIGDGFAVRTLRTADMYGVVDASLDRAASLADDDGYVLAARALAGVDATSAIFSAASFRAEDLFERLKPLTTAGAFQTSEETLRDRLHEAPLLKPFELVAVGTAFDGTDPFTALMLVHETSRAASENADLLRQRIETSMQPLNAPVGRKADESPRAEPRYWRDVIERYDIAADGRVLVARLYGASAFSLLVPSDHLGFGGLPLTPLTVSE